MSTIELHSDGAWYCSQHGVLGQSILQPRCGACATGLAPSRGATSTPLDIVSRREGLAYEQRMDHLASCVRTLLHFDVPELREVLNRADTAGFLQGPLQYGEHGLEERLEHQRRLLDAVEALQGVVAGIEADVQRHGLTRDSASTDGGRWGL